MRHQLALWALAVILPFSALAAHLTLRDGTTYNGTFISGNSRTVTFQDNSGSRHTVEIRRIRSIDFSNNHDNRADRAADGLTTSHNSQPAPYPGSYANNTEAPTVLIIPAGTEIIVRPNTVVDSHAPQGQAYAATIARDVMDENGAVMIPRGSVAQLVGSGVGGASNTALELKSVDVNGRRYLVGAGDAHRSLYAGIAEANEPLTFRLDEPLSLRPAR